MKVVIVEVYGVESEGGMVKSRVKGGGSEVERNEVGLIWVLKST